MILPPQMTCRDLVLMASDYSATAPDSQSTTPRDHVGSVALLLRQASRRSAGKKLQDKFGTVETVKRRSYTRLTTTVRMKWPYILAALVLQ